MLTYAINRLLELERYGVFSFEQRQGIHWAIYELRKALREQTEGCELC